MTTKDTNIVQAIECLKRAIDTRMERIKKEDNKVIVMMMSNEISTLINANVLLEILASEIGERVNLQLQEED